MRFSKPKMKFFKAQNGFLIVCKCKNRPAKICINVCLIFFLQILYVGHSYFLKIAFFWKLSLNFYAPIRLLPPPSLVDYRLVTFQLKWLKFRQGPFAGLFLHFHTIENADFEPKSIKFVQNQFFVKNNCYFQSPKWIFNRRRLKTLILSQNRSNSYKINFLSKTIATFRAQNGFSIVCKCKNRPAKICINTCLLFFLKIVVYCGINFFFKIAFFLKTVAQFLRSYKIAPPPFFRRL